MPWVEHASVNWGHWDLRSWMDRSLPDHVLERFNEDQFAFDIRFLEDLLARVGESPEFLAQLGYLYTQVSRYREALAVDRRLVTLRPRDATASYNLACSHALLSHTNAAFTALKRAIGLGYRDWEHMQSDTDLENLRGDPRWDELMAALKV